MSEKPFPKEISFSVSEKIARSYIEDKEVRQDFVDYLFLCHADVVNDYIDSTMDLFKEYLECGWEEP